MHLYIGVDFCGSISQRKSTSILVRLILLWKNL